MKISLSHNYPEPDIFEQAQEMGCKWLYFDICWPRIQPAPEVFDFSYYDPLIEKCHRSGINVIGMVSSRRVTFPDDHWIWNNHHGMMPDFEAWERFLGEVTNRYKHVIQHWEVWSEPNCVACNPID